MSKLQIVSSIPKIIMVGGAPKIYTPEKVIFGNLGANNTDAISSTSITLTGNNFYMIGFNTGNTSRLKIAYATFYLRHASDSIKASIYSNIDNLPGSLLINSIPINPIKHSSSAKYRFFFNNYLLSANTTYWIGITSNCSWYVETVPEIYTDYNNSGYSFVNRARSLNGLNGPWSYWDPIIDEGFTTGVQLSLSIEAY